MATKSTRRKQKYNKSQQQQLAISLDTISKNVSNRGAFVVIRDPKGDYFTIMEALKKRLVLTHIMAKSTAQALCVRLNSRNKPGSPYRKPNEVQMIRTQKLLDRYADLFTESIFHKHTVTTTKDDFMRDVGFIRLHETIIKLKSVSEELKHQL